MNKIVKIAVGVFIAAILLGVVYYLYPKSYIKISIAPDQAALSIDGGQARTVTSGSTIIVGAGKHTYTLSHSDFSSVTTTLTSANNETQELLVALTAKTTAAEKLLQTTNSLNIIERIGALKQNSGTNTLIDTYPVLAILPYTSHSFEIYACASQKYPGDSSKIALCVYSNDPNAVKPIIEDSLQSQGYDPSQYEIIYEPAGTGIN